MADAEDAAAARASERMDSAALLLENETRMHRKRHGRGKTGSTTNRPTNQRGEGIREWGESILVLPSPVLFRRAEVVDDSRGAQSAGMQARRRSCAAAERREEARAHAHVHAEAVESDPYLSARISSARSTWTAVTGVGLV